MLDWEYACDNDPLFGLAVVVGHHGLPERQASLLLDAWFDGKGACWRGQLAVRIRLYDALNWLWATANDQVRRGPDTSHWRGRFRGMIDACCWPEMDLRRRRKLGATSCPASYSADVILQN